MFEDLEVITLSDKKEYLVLKKVIIDNKKYLITISLDDKKETKILEVIDESIMKVKDVFDKKIIIKIREELLNNTKNLANIIENN